MGYVKSFSIHWVLAALFFFGSTGATCRAEEKEVTLDQALEVALKRNPDIESSGYEIEESGARVTQAESAYFPQVSMGAGYAYKGVVIREMAGVPARTSDRYNDYSSNLSASQYLYDFGKTTGAVDQRRFEHESTRKGLSATRSQVIRDVKRTYYEVLKRKGLVKVNDDSLRSQEKHLEQAKALHGVGLRPKIDVTKGEVEYAQSRLQFLDALYSYNSSRVDLENLLGGPPVEGAYALKEVTQPATEPEVLDSLLQEALKSRPEIERLELEINAAEAQIEAIEGEFWPTITADAAYQLENYGFPLNTTWQAGLTLTWPIYSGPKRYGQIKEIRATISRLKAQTRKTRLQVTKEVSLALIERNKAIEGIETAKTALRQAEENMDMAEGRYRSGTGDAIEYSDAELNLTQAKSSLVQTTYNFLQSLSDLDYAVGR
ncbi:MAG: TolC family protein [Desulfobacterales bacterium]|nr:TolC family protein [Desulfobacterales bacterium]